jgi:hypothetical protein
MPATVSSLSEKSAEVVVVGGKAAKPSCRRRAFDAGVDPQLSHTMHLPKRSRWGGA